jgi:branched-chain amino acid aminotransferase
MIVFLNGQFVPEERALISVFDRGFLYGDGLFEAFRVANGSFFRWRQHIERLEHGAAVLRLNMPFDAKQLRDDAERLILENQFRDGLVRLTISRGRGPRGYSPKGAQTPTVTMTCHPLPASDELSWHVITASIRVPANDLLAQLKTCNKLPHVMARAEADDAGAQEALLLNSDGHVTEGSSSNVF